LLPAIAPTLFFAVLIVAEPDLGTAMVCVAVTCAVLFTAGMYYRYLGIGILATLPFLGYLILMKPWRLKRILVFLNPEADPQSTGYQIIQSLIAVGTGGLTGTGIDGRVSRKLFYLPEAHTDFIFAVIAEEWGLLGALCVVILFAVFCWRGHANGSAHASDSFARLLAIGVTSMVGMQAIFQHQRGHRVAPGKRESLCRWSATAALRWWSRWRVSACYSTSLNRRIDMRAIIAGGGTGGHVIPALAIAQELKARYRLRTSFVGTARGMEAKLVPAAGYDLKLIEVGQLNRVSLATRLKTLLGLPLAILSRGESSRSSSPTW
jgi:hypothetical protein